MKYYKIIKDGEVIGAINSDNFISFQPVTQCFLRSNEQQGEYVSYNGSLYRDRWMKPIVWQATFIQAQILEIDEATYQIFIDAIEHDEEIPGEETEIPETDPVPNPSDVASLAFIKNAKINEMSYTCRNTIENGFDLDIRGKVCHFSLTTQDQLNLMNLNIMAQTEDLIPYHADGEECTFYTAEEIRQIVSAATSLKNYQTAYYNALKIYINALDTIEDVNAIVYGTPIPEEYKSDVLKILE